MPADYPEADYFHWVMPADGTPGLTSIRADGALCDATLSCETNLTVYSRVGNRTPNWTNVNAERLHHLGQRSPRAAHGPEVKGHGTRGTHTQAFQGTPTLEQGRVNSKQMFHQTGPSI